MLNSKVKKNTILNKIGPSMKGFILTGIVFVASNLGFNYMIQSQFNNDFNKLNNAQFMNKIEMREHELENAKVQNNKNIVTLQDYIKNNTKSNFFNLEGALKVPEFHSVTNSKSNDFLYCLQFLHQKFPTLDWSNEQQVNEAAMRYLPFSLQADFIEHYKKFDPSYLQQVLNAKETSDNFIKSLNFNVAQMIAQDKKVFSQPNKVREKLIQKFKDNNQYIDTNQTQFLESVQVLNTYDDKFLNIDHEYNTKFLYSIKMQMALLLASFAFSFLFWLNFPDNKDIQYFKRKSHYKVSKKFFYRMSEPSRDIVKKCYKKIEQQAFIPQNFFSLEGFKYIIHSIKTNGLDIRLHYFKLKKDTLSLIDKLYLLIPFVAILGLVDYHELNWLDGVILLCFIVIYVCLSIQSTRIYDMKNYIQKNYTELSQQYPEFLLKLFMGDVDCKTVDYINFSKKNHCPIELCSVLEEQEKVYLTKLKKQMLENEGYSFKSESSHLLSSK